MSDYVKGQNFTSLRGTTPADPAIFDTEFSSVATASATKMDKSGGTFTGAISVPSGASGNNAVRANEIYKYAFPSGTVMTFFQASAPTGWTQVTTHNDAMLRVVSGTGGGTGGTNGASLGVPATATGSHTLTVDEMPAHTHTYDRFQQVSSGGNVLNSLADFTGQQGTASTTSTGGGAGHTHTLTSWVPKYVDMILASKD